MNFKPSLKRAIAATLICVAGVAPCLAELPMMQDGESLGYFIALEERSFKFGVTPDGKAEIRIVSKKGDLMGSELRTPISFLVEQTMPDGKIVHLPILPETLESNQKASVDPKQTTILGKVKGDAKVEMTIEKSRNGVLLGGRILDQGKLTANPIRFCISFRMLDVYANARKAWATNGDKGKDAMLKDDRVVLTMADKKKVKVPTSESINASTKEFNGPGIMAAEITLGVYQGKVFELAASPNSTLTFSNDKPGPLNEGFWVRWTADAAKDLNGTSRMSIVLK